MALIDLNEMSGRFYEALGPQQAPKAFARGDATHHNNYGSYELARSIVQGIRDARLPIARFLYPSPAFDPGRPDPLAAFDIPAEPLPEAAPKPYGN